jgi:predicted nucleotidyltransferase
MNDTANYHGFEKHKESIAAFCRRWQIKELSFFGSVLRSDFGLDSDIDVLVTFSPEAKWNFEDFINMKDEFEAILGRPVDFVEKHLVEQSKNYIRRKHILSHAEAIYVA